MSGNLARKIGFTGSYLSIQLSMFVIKVMIPFWTDSVWAKRGPHYGFSSRGKRLVRCPSTRHWCRFYKSRQSTLFTARGVDSFLYSFLSFFFFFFFLFSLVMPQCVPHHIPRLAYRGRRNQSDLSGYCSPNKHHLIDISFKFSSWVPAWG